jgi:hypothetical protein
MIAFRLSSDYGDYYLDVPTDIAVTYSATNALFDVAHLARAYSLDFTIPRTPRTDAQLQHRHRLDSAESSNQIRTEMLVQGNPFDTGFLEIDDVEDGYRVHFRSQERDLLDQLDKPLSDFCTEMIVLDPTFGATNGVKVTLQTPANLSVVRAIISIDGNLFQTDYDAVTINEGYIDLTTKINQFYQAEIATQNGQFMTIVRGQVFTIEAVSNATIEVFNDTADHTHAQILAGINALVANPNAEIVFPVIHAPNAMTDNTTYQSKTKNLNDVTTLGAIMPNGWTLSKTDFRNAIVPMVRVCAVLRRIAEKLDMTITGDWYDHPEAKKLIFINSVTIDDIKEKDVEADPNRFVRYFLNRHKTSFDMANHLPDMSAKDLLTELCEDWGAVPKITGKVLRLDRKKNHLKNPALHLTNEIVADKIKFEVGQNKGVKLAYDWTETKKYMPITGTYAPLSIGSEKTGFVEVTQHFNTLLKQTSALEGYDLARLPTFWGDVGELPKTLIFYRGIAQSLLNSTPFPYATPDNLNQNHEDMGDWSMSLLGNKGMYKTHLQSVIELKAARTATALFRLTINHLSGFRRQEITRIFAYTPNGELNAVVKDIQFKFKNGVIEPATLNLLRL